MHDFVPRHERVYVVEQNRDAQMLQLLKLDVDSRQVGKLRSVLHFNGLPIDARSITDEFISQEGCKWQRTPLAPGTQRPIASAFRCSTTSGGKTTLCAGCGHNAISERIIDAFYEMGVQPERVMKLSGIGCSSKSPAYFMSRSHSFNSVHGRMPSVATGALWPTQHALPSASAATAIPPPSAWASSSTSCAAICR